MSCCADGSGTGLPARAAARWPGWLAVAAQWALPLTTLILVPKCPGCVGAYVLLLTGIGLSFSAAAAMRWAVIAVCVLVLARLVIHAVRRLINGFGGRRC